MRISDLDLASGVDYSKLDPFKRACLAACAQTMGYLDIPGVKPVRETLGESAFLFEIGRRLIAHVEEGLGSKDVVADIVDAMCPLAESHYRAIGQDTLAMIANDLATCGAEPVSALMHCAAGDDSWFEAVERTAALIDGWRQGCETLGCAWGGGESPALRDVVMPGRVVLSGSMTGIIRKRSHWVRARNLKRGAVMVALLSSGVHANGLTGIRANVAPKIGYGASLSSYGGEYTFGDALLTPTILYWPVIRDCQRAGIKICYAVNVTGHGLRKLMRAPQALRYEVDRLPEVAPVFKVIAAVTGKSIAEMYASYNMGVGFVLFVSKGSVAEVSEIANRHQIKALELGRVVASRDKKRSVHIAEHEIVYEEESLSLR